MKTAITAIGTANPRYLRSQNEAAELITQIVNLTPAEKRLLKSVYKATGIEQRYSVISDYSKDATSFEFFPDNPTAPFPTTAKRMQLYKASALQLALTAIQNCLASLATFNKQEITHVITVSCTGMYAPGLDIEIVQQLELNSHTKRTAINFMGCYGAFNAIKVADAICKAEPNAKILIVCVELCTIHFQKKFDVTNIVANAIFADGAAAALIQANPTEKKYLSLESFYCDLLPQSSQEMAWQIADEGFDIVLSSYVPEAIESGIAKFTQKLLLHAGLSAIDIYAIHPGGLKVLQACEAALNITPEDNHHAYAILRKYGNMSSATILFVLKNIWDSLQQADHEKNIFSCAFGPGLTLESMILRTHNL